jgi:hypothetical protein
LHAHAHARDPERIIFFPRRRTIFNIQQYIMIIYYLLTRTYVWLLNFFLSYSKQVKSVFLKPSESFTKFYCFIAGGVHDDMHATRSRTIYKKKKKRPSVYA